MTSIDKKIQKGGWSYQKFKAVLLKVKKYFDTEGLELPRTKKKKRNPQ